MQVGHTDLWIRVTQLSQQPNNPWSYGIMSWKTSNGYELGSTKVYGHTASEVFRLTIGRPPYERTGQLEFVPRSFNLGWIKAGYDWTLKFEAASGVTTSGGGGSTLGAISNGFVNNSGDGLSLVRVQFP